MNESLVLENPRSDGWPGKEPDQEDEATYSPVIHSFTETSGLCIDTSNFTFADYFKLKGKKVKAFPESIPSVGPGADPGVQAVSPQVTVSHPPGGRLPLLTARLAVTSPAAEHHRP